MRRSIFFVVFVLFSVSAIPPQLVVAESATPLYEWTSYIEKVSGIGANIEEMETTSDGSVYVLGEFNGTVDFDPEGAGNVVASVSGSDLYIGKWNADGTNAWVRTFGHTASHSTSSFPEHFINVDSADNVYFIGTYRGSLNFNPTGSDIRTAQSFSDPFVTKWNADGTYGWTHTFGSPGTGTDSVGALAVTQAGDVYIGGDFSGSPDFDPTGAGDIHSAVGAPGDRDAYITRINANGSYGWTNTFGSDDDDYLEYQSLVLAGDGDGIFAMISFSGASMDADPSAGDATFTSTGAFNTLVIAKYGFDGSYVWGNAFGNDSSVYVDKAKSDSNGNLYIFGDWGSTMDFDYGPGTDIDTATTSNTVFIMRVNADGSYGWSRRSGSAARVQGLEIGASGIYGYVTTPDTGPFDINRPGPAEIITPSGDWDNFVSSWDFDGNYRWTKQIGSVDYEYGYELAVSPVCDSVYTLGETYPLGASGSINFDQDGSDIRSIPSTGAFFMNRFSESGQYSWTHSVDTADILFFVVRSAVGPGDSIYFGGEAEGAAVNFNDGGSDVVSVASEEVTFITKLSNVNYRQHVINLGSTVNALELGSGDSARLGETGVTRTGSSTLRVPDADTNNPIADITVDLSCDRDWSGVDGDSDAVEGTSYISGLIAAEGTASSLDLYIPRLVGSTGVGVCPGVSSLAAITDGCAGYTEYAEGDPSLTTTTVSGQEYWVVAAQPDSGGGNVLGATTPADPASPDTTDTSTDDSELADTGVSVVGIISFGMLIAIIAAFVQLQTRKYGYKLLR